MTLRPVRITAVLVAAMLAGCASKMEMGSQRAKTVATGAAAGANAANANAQLERCDSPMGTVSLVENQQDPWQNLIRQVYRLPPTGQLMRLIIQQSNCFVVVERSAAGMIAMERERALMHSGQARANSNFGGGQVVASDYALSLDVIFSEEDAGGARGVMSGIGRAFFGGLVSRARTQQASVMMALVDNRSGVQISVSEGSAANRDWSGGLAGLFSRAGGGLGSYNKNPQGKVIAAAFMDGYNNMVGSLRDYKAQQVEGQGLGSGGRLNVDGGTVPSQTSAVPDATVPEKAN